MLRLTQIQAPAVHSTEGIRGTSNRIPGTGIRVTRNSEAGFPGNPEFEYPSRNLPAQSVSPLALRPETPRRPDGPTARQPAHHVAQRAYAGRG